MKYMWMIVFLVLPFIGLGYALWHIWRILPFSNVVKYVVITACIAAFLTFFLSFTGLTDNLPLSVASVVYETGTSALIIMLYLVMLFLLLDIAHLCHIIPKGWLQSNACSSVAVLLIIVAILVYGNINYNNKRRIELPLEAYFGIGEDPVKIVLLSDLHLGYGNRRADFAKWVDKVNAEKPDLILIGGDIIDMSIKPLLEENVAEEFKRFNAPVYACLGNHEYYSGKERSIDFYKRAGINLLIDSVATIGKISIIGRDDRTNGNKKSVDELIKGVPQLNYTILLDHQPYNLREADFAGIDFQFSGHTHRGQVWPVSLITDHIFEKSYGYLRRWNTDYYVSSGIGIWGGKFRIGTCSEYVVATVTSRKKEQKQY